MLQECWRAAHHSPGTRFVYLKSVCALLLAIAFIDAGARPAVAQTISPGQILGRYQQFIWQDRDGLPANGVGAIAQTPDGYLWLGTSEGVVRFDGVRFTTFDRTTTPEIGNNNIHSLLVDRSGALWIGSHAGGVTRYQAGRFTSLSTTDGLSDTRAYSIFQDSLGGIWIGTEGGVNLFRDGRFITYSTANGLPNDHVYAVTEDAAGAIWLGTLGGLAQIQGGRVTTYTIVDGLPSNAIRSLAWDVATASLWIGTDAGLARRHQDRFTVVGLREGMAPSQVKALTLDKQGTLWAGTAGHGLHRVEQGRVTSATTHEGLAHDMVQAIHEDTDGNLWLGTNAAGLVQLRLGRFLTYTTRDGLPDDLVRPIFEDRAGQIWVGSDAGLARYINGKFVPFLGPGGRPYRYVTGLQQDRGGTLWIDTYRPGSPGTAIASTTAPPNEHVIAAGWHTRRFTAMLEDRSGTFWFGTSSDGLHRISGGRATAYRPQNGLADHHVTRLFEDSAGAVWIATAGGLSRFSDNRLRTFTTADGFSALHVLSFYEDRAGHLWIGTYGDGLYRYAAGRFVAISSIHGLYDNLAYEILEDDYGNLWMGGNRGIYRASLEDLNAVADGRASALRSYAYGVADGMLSREANGANPAGLKARDGRLWFPTVRGVVVVDPVHVDREAPTPVIEAVTIDGRVQPPDQPIRLEPGQGNLEIQYTAIHWARASQVSFKYQVAGLDHDWVDAGTRRTVYFPHLPPGQYTFRVIADNGEGIWNTEGRSLAIVVRPPFYRTWWFITLSAGSLLGLVVLVARVRIRQVETERNIQQTFSRTLIASQEEERRRIAAELHDSLGQSLLIIKNRIALAKGDGSADRVDAEVVREQLEELSASTADAINECREIAYNLRPYHISRFGLSKTLDSMFRRISEVAPIAVSTHFDVIDDLLPEDAQVNLFRVVQECVNNIIKHSQASEASLTVTRRDDRIDLVISDNGIGFAPAEMAEPTGDVLSGGFGLMGIAERVRMLGGRVSIDSSAGTTIRISLQGP